MSTAGPPAGSPGVLPGAPLTEEERRPLIDDAGRALLATLLEHDRAPRFNHTCGDRLTADGLASVQAFDAEVAGAAPVVAGPSGWPDPPPWVEGFAAHCLRHVPAYRRHGPLPRRFDEIPTIGRRELVDAPWSFVPDDHPLDEMVVYTTTGTSGGGLAYIASTPETASSYQVLLRAALATRGLDLRGGAGRTAVALVCWQRSTYTYASVSSFLGQAGVLKLNLSPDDWRDPSDVTAYLDALDPEVVTGDPIAFAHLAELDVSIRPTALVSTAMTLTDGLRDRLESRFGCPALDVYGLNEAGPVAVALPSGGGHVVLQPKLHVEVLDAEGRPCPPGERGEVVLTGGFNPALPLLRYRTGDHAAVEVLDGRVVLVGLEGRPPVALEAADGRALNTIDVTMALRPFPIARSRVHQRADRSLLVGIDAPGPVDEAEVGRALEALFGPVGVTIESMAGEPEQLPYSSELTL